MPLMKKVQSIHLTLFHPIMTHSLNSNFSHLAVSASSFNRHCIKYIVRFTAKVTDLLEITQCYQLCVDRQLLRKSLEALRKIKAIWNATGYSYIIICQSVC